MAGLDVFGYDDGNRQRAYNKEYVLDLIKKDIEAEDFEKFYLTCEPVEAGEDTKTSDIYMYKGRMLMILYKWKEYELLKEAYKKGADHTFKANTLYYCVCSGEEEYMREGLSRVETKVEPGQWILATPCFDEEILRIFNEIAFNSIQKPEIIRDFLNNPWLRKDKLVDLIKNNLENVKKMKSTYPLLFSEFFNFSFTSEIVYAHDMYLDEILESVKLLMELVKDTKDSYKIVEIICAIGRSAYNIDRHNNKDYSKEWAALHKHFLKQYKEDDNKELLQYYLIHMLSTFVSSKKYEDNENVFLDLLEEIKQAWPRDFYDNKLIIKVCQSNAFNKINIIKLAKLLMKKPLCIRRTKEFYQMLERNNMFVNVNMMISCIMSMVDVIYGVNEKSEKSLIDKLEILYDEEILLSILDTNILTKKGYVYLKKRLSSMRLYKYIPVVLAYEKD